MDAKSFIQHFIEDLEAGVDYDDDDDDNPLTIVEELLEELFSTNLDQPQDLTLNQPLDLSVKKADTDTSVTDPIADIQLTIDLDDLMTEWLQESTASQDQKKTTYAAAPAYSAAPAYAYKSYAAPAPIAYKTAAAPLAYAAAPVAEAVDNEYDPNPQYNYAYEVQDSLTGNAKSQQETRNGDNVQGSYSLIEADGSRRIVEYTADEHNGFNAVVHKEAPAVAVKAAAPVAAYSAPLAYKAHQYY